MAAEGFFIKSDREVISRAASVAEGLVGDYFVFGQDEWQRNPYGLFSRMQISREFHDPHSFASVIRYEAPRTKAMGNRNRQRYGIVLQDPNILAALLRSPEHDLWTLGLFIMIHELIHIVRFRTYSVDFFAGEGEREREERIVYGITRELLTGAGGASYVMDKYGDYLDSVD